MAVLASSAAGTRLMVQLGSYAGLRRAEISRVHAHDVTDLGLRVTGRGNKVRVGPLHQLLVKSSRASTAGRSRPRGRHMPSQGSTSGSTTSSTESPRRLASRGRATHCATASPAAPTPEPGIYGRSRASWGTPTPRPRRDTRRCLRTLRQRRWPSCSPCQPLRVAGGDSCCLGQVRRSSSSRMPTMSRICL